MRRPSSSGEPYTPPIAGTRASVALGSAPGPPYSALCRWLFPAVAGYVDSSYIFSFSPVRSDANRPALLSTLALRVIAFADSGLRALDRRRRQNKNPARRRRMMPANTPITIPAMLPPESEV